MAKAELIARGDKIRLVKVPNEENQYGFNYVVEQLTSYDALGGECWELRRNVTEYNLESLFRAIFDFPSVNGAPL